MARDDLDLDDEDDIEYMDEGDEQVAPPRWLPAIVLLIAVGGFIALSWYAYNSGSRNTDEEDLILVEADDSPTKEKPLDPGGMKFPHQDKSVFDTISSGMNKMPQGEHVMPAPEEPVRPEIKSDGTMKADVPQTAEELLPAEKVAEKPAQKAAEPVKEVVKETPKEAPVLAVKPEEPKKEQKTKLTDKFLEKPLLEGQPPTVQAGTTVTQTDGGTVTTTASSTEVKAEPVAEKPKAVAEKPKEVKPVAAKPAAGGKLVQLGAYKSEAEAEGAFKAMQKKTGQLGSLKPIIVKADLGEKGIFYRLRVGVSDAKSFCAQMKVKGQACIPVS